MTKYVAAMMLILGMSSFAQAQGDGPCAKDRETLCAGIEPGDGAVMKCMMENKDKLSAECKAHHEKMKGHRHEAMEACKADKEKFCGDVKHGDGRIMKCMMENKDKFSETCKAEMAKRKEMRRQAKKGK